MMMAIPAQSAPPQMFDLSSLKCTDNKTIAGLLNSASHRLLREHIHFTQTGFIPGRQLATNIVDIDFYSRIASFKHYGKVRQQPQQQQQSTSCS